MDLPKFVALLDTQSLYHSAPQFLGDRWESMCFYSALQALDLFHKSKIKDFSYYRDLCIQMTHSRGVSCWYRDQAESMAMWQLYASRGSGIAIRSTVGRLRDSAANCPEELWLGPVKYLDFDKIPKLPWDNLVILSRKRREFRFEREVRSLMPLPQLIEREQPKSSSPKTLEDNVAALDEVMTAMFKAPRYAEGVSLPLNLPELIHSIWLAPGMPQWHRRVIESLLEHYCLPRKLLMHSRLDEATR